MTSDLRPAPGGIVLPRGGALTVSFPLTNANGTPYTGLSGTLDLYVKLAGSGKLDLTLDDSQAATGLLTGTLTGLQSAQLAEGRTYPLMLVQQEGEADEWQIAAVELLIARKGQGNGGSVTSATQSVQVVSGGSVIQTSVLAGPTVTINSGGGGGGSAGGYDHVQNSAATTWTINHNLGYRPAVSLLSVGGVEMEATVTHISANQVQATFASAVAGRARLA